MSVDTCQKYSLCPEKAVCGVTAVRPPLTHSPAPPAAAPPPHRDSVQATQKLPVLAPGEKESERERESRQGRSSALLHQDKCFPSCSLTSLHSYCPRDECKRVLCVCLCVCVCVSEKGKACTGVNAYTGCGLAYSLPLKYSHTHKLIIHYVAKSMWTSHQWALICCRNNLHSSAFWFSTVFQNMAAGICSNLPTSTSVRSGAHLAWTGPTHWGDVQLLSHLLQINTTPECERH